MTCRDVMTPDPACCTPRDTVVTAAMIMKSNDVGSVPVVADYGDRRVIGMVTDRDLALRVVAEQRDYYNARVEDVMSRDVVTCNADDDYDDVLQAMSKHQLRRIPVVDSEKRLTGIIAQADVATTGDNKSTGRIVENISEPATEAAAGGSAWKTGLLVAGGLGLGAGLLYLFQPRFVDQARESISDATQRARDTMSSAADRVRENAGDMANRVRESAGDVANRVRETVGQSTSSNTPGSTPTQS